MANELEQAIQDGVGGQTPATPPTGVPQSANPLEQAIQKANAPSAQPLAANAPRNPLEESIARQQWTDYRKAGMEAERTGQPLPWPPEIADPDSPTLKTGKMPDNAPEAAKQAWLVRLWEATKDAAKAFVPTPADVATAAKQGNLSPGGVVGAAVTRAGFTQPLQSGIQAEETIRKGVGERLAGVGQTGSTNPYERLQGHAAATKPLTPEETAAQFQLGTAAVAPIAGEAAGAIANPVAKYLAQTGVAAATGAGFNPQDPTVGAAMFGVPAAVAGGLGLALAGRGESGPPGGVERRGTGPEAAAARSLYDIEGEYNRLKNAIGTKPPTPEQAQQLVDLDNARVTALAATAPASAMSPGAQAVADLEKRRAAMREAAPQPRAGEAPAAPEVPTPSRAPAERPPLPPVPPEGGWTLDENGRPTYVPGRAGPTMPDAVTRAAGATPPTDLNARMASRWLPGEGQPSVNDQMAARWLPGEEPPAATGPEAPTASPNAPSERIVAAATRHIPTGDVATGQIHLQAMEKMRESGKYPDTWGRGATGAETLEQGFLTDRGRFVNRAEAERIALESGQVNEEEVGGMPESHGAGMGAPAEQLDLPPQEPTLGYRVSQGGGLHAFDQTRYPINPRTQNAPPGTEGVQAETAASSGAAKQRMSFAEQKAAFQQLADENGISRLDLDSKTIVNPYAGPQVMAMREELNTNWAQAAAIDKQLADPTLLADKATALEATRAQLMARNDELLRGVVRETASIGRNLGYLNQLAAHSLDPDVWAVNAQRLAGDVRIPDAVLADIRNLARIAMEACAGGV